MFLIVLTVVAAAIIQWIAIKIAYHYVPTFEDGPYDRREKAAYTEWKKWMEDDHE